MRSKNKNITNNIATKPFAVGSHEGQIMASVPYTQEDFKNALLIVSLAINASVLIAWILTQLNVAYTYQIALALLGQ